LLAIMLNAQRLHSDAKLLLDNGRYASAVALAVIAIEEVGKLLLLAEQTTPEKITGHWQKRGRMQTSSTRTFGSMRATT
jgi:AbiV family abortive infection protein